MSGGRGGRPQGLLGEAHPTQSADIGFKRGSAEQRFALVQLHRAAWPARGLQGPEDHGAFHLLCLLMTALAGPLDALHRAQRGPLPPSGQQLQDQ